MDFLTLSMIKLNNENITYVYKLKNKKWEKKHCSKKQLEKVQEVKKILGE